MLHPITSISQIRIQHFVDVTNEAKMALKVCMTSRKTINGRIAGFNYYIRILISNEATYKTNYIYSNHIFIIFC